MERNPWKIATIAIMACLFGAVVSGIVVAKSNHAGSEAAALEVFQTPDNEPVPDGVAPPLATAPAPVQQALTPTSAPVSVPLEDCERHRWAAQRDNGRVVRDGAVGGLIGAGLGAATGAIINGGKGAGKGAGIGALLGVTGGAIHGYTEESRRADQARQAYYACMARRNG
ncbi:MAG: hypothetical protein IH884_15965 [Myxococcales bacterium]|nr:hypothetical protein [Myxococcales bacterium]